LNKKIFAIGPVGHNFDNHQVALSVAIYKLIFLDPLWQIDTNSTIFNDENLRNVH